MCKSIECLYIAYSVGMQLIIVIISINKLNNTYNHHMKRLSVTLIKLTRIVALVHKC